MKRKKLKYKSVVKLGEKLAYLNSFNFPKIHLQYRVRRLFN